MMLGNRVLGLRMLSRIRLLRNERKLFVMMLLHLLRLRLRLNVFDRRRHSERQFAVVLLRYRSLRCIWLRMLNGCLLEEVRLMVDDRLRLFVHRLRLHNGLVVRRRRRERLHYVYSGRLFVNYLRVFDMLRGDLVLLRLLFRHLPSLTEIPTGLLLRGRLLGWLQQCCGCRG
jgi:hypothetical protein